MSNQNLFEITLRRIPCIQGLSEDSLRALVDALQITLGSKEFSGIVTSSPGAQTQFVFSPNGNFDGVTAKINGQNVVLIPGNNSKVLGTFYGAPSSTNPGPGWEPDVALTKKYLGQGPDQNTWEIFYAKRVNAVNNI